jgi:hypothetical protein
VVPSPWPNGGPITLGKRHSKVQRPARNDNSGGGNGCPIAAPSSLSAARESCCGVGVGDRQISQDQSGADGGWRTHLNVLPCRESMGELCQADGSRCAYSHGRPLRIIPARGYDHGLPRHPGRLRRSRKICFVDCRNSRPALFGRQIVHPDHGGTGPRSEARSLRQPVLESIQGVDQRIGGSRGRRFSVGLQERHPGPATAYEGVAREVSPGGRCSWSAR